MPRLITKDNCLHLHSVTHHWLTQLRFILSIEQPSNQHQQGQSTLPPVPPLHKQQPSVTALNHNSLSCRRNVSPAPPAALPAELQTTPESVPLQDSWVLGSNVPLESRSVTQSHTPAQLHPKVWPVLWKGPLFAIPHTAGHVTFISFSKHCRAYIYIYIYILEVGIDSFF